MRIGINCGHTVNGQPGSGAVGIINESNETRVVGKNLIDKLKSMGHTVIDCTDDYADTTNNNLNKICRLANAQPLDLFVSIHFNSGRGKGTEVYTYGGAKHSEAVNVCKKMNDIGFVNRGVKDGSKLFVIRKTNAKALLVEVCFVDTQSDVSLYKANISKVVSAIAEGITGTSVAVTSEDRLTMFKDIPTTDSAFTHIKKLKDYGIVNGYEDGTFRPDSIPTRRDVAVMIANALTYIGK